MDVEVFLTRAVLYRQCYMPVSSGPIDDGWLDEDPHAARSQASVFCHHRRSLFFSDPSVANDTAVSVCSTGRAQESLPRRVSRGTTASLWPVLEAPVAEVRTWDRIGLSGLVGVVEDA